MSDRLPPKGGGTPHEGGVTTDPPSSSPARFLRNVLVKGLLLFALANLLFAALPPAALGRLSLYNRLIPGRARFPFGENPQAAYNLSLYNLNAMFASHEIAAAGERDEYRVVILGDSSVWGTLLRPAETLAGQLNARGLTCAGRPLRVYNLGYPTISLTKDLMLLRRALAYQPDLIVWPLTLEALPRDKQLASPLAANNVAELLAVGRDAGLVIVDQPARPAFWERTIIGQRRALADLFRLQAYGLMWAATGIDQEYPAKSPPAQVDFEPDVSFHTLSGPDFPPGFLAWEVLHAGVSLAERQGVPVLLVNEPMLISSGKNSDLRYNFFYPRWAYDAYRADLTARAAASNIPLLDAWDLLPPAEFTNSAIHLTPAGEAVLADAVAAQLCR